MRRASAAIKRVLKRRTIQADLMVALAVFAIVPVTLVNLFYYQHTRALMRQNAVGYGQELVRQTGRQIEAVLLEMDIVQRQITSYFNSPRSSPYVDAATPGERVAIATNAESFLRDVRRSITSPADIYVRVSDGSFFTTNSFANQNLLLGQDFFQVAGPGRPRVPLVFTGRAGYATYRTFEFAPQVVSFVSHMTVYTRVDMSAVVLIDLDYDRIKNIVEAVDFGPGAVVTIHDSQGDRILSSAARSEGGEAAAAPPEKALTYSYRLRDSDWEIVVAVPEEQISVRLRPALRNWVAIIAVAAAFSVGASYLLSLGITRALRELIKAMERTGEGVFAPVTTDSSEVELIALSETYNRMVQQIDHLMRNVKEKETEKSSAQLRALEAQINPHFLYNTLETLRSIALQHKLASVAQIAKSLADMFRYSIDRKREFVTLEEELGHVRNYMSIQQQRYGDRIRVEYLVDGEILHCRTIKLILQPLVENAVVHGLELKAGEGRILISAYLLEGKIYINVVDDGLGIGPAVVEQLNLAFRSGGLDGAGIDSKVGLGLSNVDRRIKHYYGPEYGLWVSSKPGTETLVRVCIPVIQ